MNKLLKYLFAAPLFLASCQAPDSNAVESANEISTEDTSNTLPDYFTAVLEAHGGLNNWDQFGAMEYELINGDKTETHRIDLKNRKDLVIADAYSIGYDGEQVWVSPNKAAFPGQSARFYHNLYFYFFAIPFVLADPGVHYQQLEPTQLQGKTFETIEISFANGVGDTPEDKYRMLIDPETHRMEWLLYTVTYFSKDTADKFNALKYEDYAEHNGLLFPGKLTGYKYENGEIGEARYTATFQNLKLSQEQPDQQQFRIPENAEIDSLTI